MGLDPGAIAAIDPGWGDPHRGGQTVARVTLDSGLRLGHKPRSVEPERLWATAVQAVERRLDLGLQAPQAVSRGHHGWVEWIEPEPGALASARSLRRAGAMVALLDLLEVRDAHRDNFVFARGQPILVDAETIGHPRLPGFAPVPSIILTGALPWPPGTRHRAILSGLTGTVAGEAAVVSGYRAVHRLVRERGPAWLRSSGVLGTFRRIRVRVVLRPSRAYSAALRRGGVNLAPPPGIDPRSGKRVLAAEGRALARGDIPLFEADLDGIDLRDERGVIVPGFFEQSGWSRIAGRLRDHAADDAGHAVTLLRSCLRLDQASRRWR